MEKPKLLSDKLVKQAACELSTIQDFIRFAFSEFSRSDLFFGHGTDNPWDEAVALVLGSLELPQGTPDAIMLSNLVSDEKQMLAKRIQKRINNRMPVAYLTNKAEFCGSEYFVDKRVLVPRSPIAELIENEFRPWVDPFRVNNILDLCTGSGCIGIACAQYFPNALVDAGDISMDCIDVAEINRQRLQVDNVAFYQSDLFKGLPEKKYDIIVSNPPYVDKEDFDSIPREFLAEPKLGLTSGDDGLDLTHGLLSEAKNWLADKGVLIIEVGNSALALEESYPHVDFTWLEFERGGHGVFLLTREQLAKL